MLIINILLIILFFIILFCDLNLVEGNETAGENYEEVQEYEAYSLIDFLGGLLLSLKQTNLSKYLDVDLGKFMAHYNSKCIDGRETIPEPFKKTLKPLMVEEDMKEINSEKNIINSFLSPFKIEIKDDYDPFETNYRSDSETSFESSKLCSLVETIYNSNGVSASLVESITDEYGNCFIKTAGASNDFIDSCKESCHIQENKLETCAVKSHNSVKNCSEYIPTVFNHFKIPIHIEKNGLYYNCSLTNLEGAGKTYIENPCIPSNICKEHSMDVLDTCGDYNPEKHLNGPCEHYYMFHEGTHYNCISDTRVYDANMGQNACRKEVNDYTEPCHKGSFVNYNECN